MKGILKLAFKLLVTDKTKFTALVGGITFAVFLMVFVTSMLIGVLNHSSAMVTNIGAPVWVMPGQAFTQPPGCCALGLL